VPVVRKQSVAIFRPCYAVCGNFIAQTANRAEQFLLIWFRQLFDAKLEQFVRGTTHNRVKERDRLLSHSA
jgi:hypothetical protein